MSTVEDIQNWVEVNRGVSLVLAVLLMAGGGLLMSQSLALPFNLGVPASVTGAPGTFSVQKTSGQPLFKTVGTGAEKIEYTATITNTADFTQEYRMSVDVLAGSMTGGSTTATISPGGTVTVAAGTEGTTTSDSVVLSPGESQKFDITVRVDNPNPGDTLKLNFAAKVPGGGWLDKTTKTVNFEKGGAGITVELVAGGVTFAAGLLLAVLAI